MHPSSVQEEAVAMPLPVRCLRAVSPLGEPLFPSPLTPLMCARLQCSESKTPPGPSLRKGQQLSAGETGQRESHPFPSQHWTKPQNPPLCGGWLLLSGAVLQFCFRKEGKPLGVEGKGLLPIFKMLKTAFPHFSRAEPGHLHRPEQAPDVPLEEINSGRQVL